MKERFIMSSPVGINARGYSKGMMIFRNISASKNSSGYKPELRNVLQQEIQNCWAFISAREFGYKYK
ncbi:MAG: hypothetical protein HXY53_00835 [Nitrospirae bacterium]|nr:hypothetical protein [Nitrospirota bacterium]